CPTDSGFLADQDRATIAKSSTLPHDSKPRVTSPAAAEGTQEIEITRLKAKVKLLEDREGGEGSGTPTEPHHTPFPEVESSHPTTSSIPLPSIPTAHIPTVTQTDTTPIIQYSRRARIAQTSALLTVADEPTSPVRDNSQGEACLTDSGFIADQDRATIAKSSTLPHDSAPRVTSPAADEGKEEIGRLKERVQVLEDREFVATKQSGEDDPIKRRSNNEGEAAAKRISNDSEEIARVLTYMDAATVLAGETNVPTGSGFIPTAGPPATVISTGSEVGPTTSLIVTRRNGKEFMVESHSKLLGGELTIESVLYVRVDDANLLVS
nr:hypothetical protein [Tanacetum cinerariifolium]